MWRELAETRFEAWVLAETGRARARVAELKAGRPGAATAELARALVRAKVLRAAAGGAAGGLVGLAAVPADLALTAWLQLSLVVELAVLFDRNLKSARAREEMLEILRAANGAARTAARVGPGLAGQAAGRLLASRGVRLFARAAPVLAAPVAAAVHARDMVLLGEEALRRYGAIPQAVRVLRARR